MAIERTYFKTRTPKENAEEVVAWLSENATEYFDSFSVGRTNAESESNVVYGIMCNVENAQLGIGLKSSSLISSSNYNDLIIKVNGGYQTPGKYMNGYITYIIWAAKTNNGIVLYGNSSHNVFITKSNKGTTCVYVHWYGYYAEGNMLGVHLHYSCDLINSSKVNGIFPSGATSSSTYSIQASTYNNSQYYFTANSSVGMTAIVPFCFDGDTYAPNMVLTPFSQYVGQSGIIEIDGVKYVYNGYVALKE